MVFVNWFCSAKVFISENLFEGKILFGAKLGSTFEEGVFVESRDTTCI